MFKLALQVVSAIMAGAIVLFLIIMLVMYGLNHYLYTSDSAPNRHIIVMNYKGEILKEFDTKDLSTYCPGENGAFIRDKEDNIYNFENVTVIEEVEE